MLVDGLIKRARLPLLVVMLMGAPALALFA